MPSKQKMKTIYWKIIDSIYSLCMSQLHSYKNVNAICWFSTFRFNLTKHIIPGNTLKGIDYKINWKGEKERESERKGSINYIKLESIYLYMIDKK